MELQEYDNNRASDQFCSKAHLLWPRPFVVKSNDRYAIYFPRCIQRRTLVGPPLCARSPELIM